MLFGGFLVKILQKKMDNHGLLMCGSLATCLFSILFSMCTDSFWLGVWLFLISVAYPFIEITIMVCNMIINDPQQIEFWMLINHGLFGVGGLLGPYLVYLF